MAGLENVKGVHRMVVALALVWGAAIALGGSGVGEEKDIPAKLLNTLTLVDVEYYSFDGKIHQGQILVSKYLAKDVKDIFNELEQIRYPIAKVRPISEYGWSDQKSIMDNNTSAFNYRHVIVVGGGSSKLSRHSYGIAIDLNPKINPFVSANGHSNRKYDPSVPGTLTHDSAAVQIFLKHGWIWGGDWESGKDYQHFEDRRVLDKIKAEIGEGD